MMESIIFGPNAVAEALRSGHAVNRIYLAQETRVRGAQELVEAARAHRVPFDFVPQAKLNELAGTREHQGVVAIISPRDYAVLEDFLAACPPRAVVLVLDQVQHPKNLGMLIRTAVGAGAAAVIVTARGGALLDESVVRASAGTLFYIPIVRCGNLAQSLRRLTEAGFWIYGLDAQGAENVFELDWAGRSALEHFIFACIRSSD